MKNNYSVFIGDVAVDEYYRCERWPAVADKANCEYLESRMGGTIANAACVHAGYRIPTLFSGYLHPDDEYLCLNLQKSGIDTSLTSFDDSLGPSKCLIFLSGGEHTVMILNTKVETIPVNDHSQKIYCKAKNIYSNLLTLDRLRYNDLPARNVLEQWRASGVNVFVDCDVDAISQTQKQLVPFLHTVIFNEVGFNNQKNGKNETDMVNELFDEGVSVVIETLAENGCKVFTREQVRHIPGIKTDVVDVTGAGDTFGANFMLFYGTSNDPFLSAEFATFAASRAVSIMGARGGVCSVNELMEYIRAKGGNSDIYLRYLKNYYDL